MLHGPSGVSVVVAQIVCAAGLASSGELSVVSGEGLGRADRATQEWISSAEDARRVMLVSAARSDQRTAPVVSAITDSGGSVVWASKDGLRVDAVLTPDQLADVVASGVVASVELWGPPAGDGVLERQASGAVFIENTLGLTGRGVVGGVTDRGMLFSHQEFAGRSPTLQTPNGDELSHGTATYGVLFAGGAVDNSVRGMLPDSTGVFASYDVFNDRDAIVAELFGPDIRGVFQSNSWGGPRTRAYSTPSVEMDDIVFRRDALLVQSQSNTGDQDSRPEAWAKNVVSVGGVDSRGTFDPSDDVWQYGASTGPSIDGRVKPDLIHFNGGLLTADSVGPSSYQMFGGTSASAPLVAGVFGLFYELWSTGELGNPVSGGDAWAERPSSALSRAMIINTARPYPFDSAADDFGRFRQGWGIPDVRALYATRDELAWWDTPVSLESGASAAYEVVSDGIGGLRVTLVYIDPPGEAFEVFSTVNDLDLIVESPSGVVYRGNVGLIEGLWSVAGGRRDRVNTVENVFIEDAEAGSWVVRVAARSVVQDSDAATPAIDQPFALVVSGASADATAGVAMSLAEPLPRELDSPWDVRVGLSGVDADKVDSVRGIVRRGGTVLGTVELTPGDDSVFSGAGPLVGCDGVMDVRFEARRNGAVVASWPRSGGFAALPRSASVVALEETFANGGGWTASGEPVRGGWEWAVPTGGGLRNDAPADVPWDGNGGCWVTEDGPGLRDVAGGPAYLTSPELDFSALVAPEMTYAVWLACEDAGEGTAVGVVGPEEDVLIVSASSNGGATWQEVDRVRSTFRWSERRADLSAFAGESSVLVRFEVSDPDDNSMTEAGIDAVRIASRSCEPCVADIDGNAMFDLSDTDAFIGLFLESAPAVDFDGSGLADLGDIDAFVSSAMAGCGG